MSEVGHGAVAADQMPDFLGGDPHIAALRASGARRLDPLQLHYLEVLSARAQAQHGRVKSILQDKLALAVADFQGRLMQVQRPAGDCQTPEKDAQPPQESLADLVRSLAPHESEKSEADLHGTITPRPELKSVRLFRNTWSKLSADKQLNTALDQAPKNAGPINSHMLVLRSLALMRDLSPDYLNRFISYADTLVHLEQTDNAKHTAPKPPKPQAEGQSGPKPKVRRARVR
jgi:hypothetical protein